jgi:hypothetical protein
MVDAATGQKAFKRRFRESPGLVFEKARKMAPAAEFGYIQLKVSSLACSSRHAALQ